jgi:hypothetical protein
MPRKFMALNLALAAVAALLIVYIVRQFVAPMPLPVGGRRAVTPPPTAAAVDMPRPPASAYAIVAAKNLFSPTRTEAPAGTTTAAAPLVRPNLFGVVVRETGSIAYLEDPTTKRVAGYRVGDRIVGGTVQTIKADGVVIDRPEGPVDVRLRDPGKPRPAQPATAAASQPSVAPALPGVIPPATPQPTQPQVARPAAQPGQPPAGTAPGQPPRVVLPPGAQPIAPPVIPGRRPLPPNLLRRLPPGMGDAPQQ